MCIEQDAPASHSTVQTVSSLLVAPEGGRKRGSSIAHCLSRTESLKLRIRETIPRKLPVKICFPRLIEVKDSFDL